MLKINKVKPRDTIAIERLGKILRPLIIEYYSKYIIEQGVEELIKFSTDELLQKEIKSKRYCYYLIEQDEKNIGFIEMHRQEDMLHISRFYLLRRYRKKGIGTATLELIKQLARKETYQSLKICVHEENKRLTKTVKKWGFNGHFSRPR